MWAGSSAPRVRPDPSDRPRAFADVHSRSANLVLVCSRHHTLIHTQGFQLSLHPDRQLSVTTADGIPVLHHPNQPWGNPAELATDKSRPISAETLPPEHCQARIALSYIVSVVLAQAA